MPSSSRATKDSGLVFGYCEICKEPLAALPIKIPDLDTMEWSTAQPKVIGADYKYYCSKQVCLGSALQKYRLVLKQGIRIKGNPVPPEFEGKKA